MTERPTAAPHKSFAHNHRYQPDVRDEWSPGVICQICGFHVSVSSPCVQRVVQPYIVRAGQEIPLDLVRVNAAEFRRQQREAGVRFAGAR